MIPSLTLTPIGVVHSPFADKRSAPRQPAAARGVAGTIVLHPGDAYAHALEDLQQWSHIWVVFWFHLNTGWKPKVLPPRSATKRGVFATRSPHRPNPLGLSVLALERVDGRVLHVRDVDIIDGTPVLDIKPYVPYTDAIADAESGWLMDDAADPGPRYRVVWSDTAETQLAWLAARSPLELRRLTEEVLSLGPAPHPYRRIKAEGSHFRLGVKDFRLRFRVQGEAIEVFEISTGYRKQVLQDASASAREDTPLEVHRAFVAQFG